MKSDSELEPKQHDSPPGHSNIRLPLASCRSFSSEADAERRSNASLSWSLPSREASWPENRWVDRLAAFRPSESKGQLQKFGDEADWSKRTQIGSKRQRVTRAKAPSITLA